MARSLLALGARRRLGNTRSRIPVALAISLVLHAAILWRIPGFRGVSGVDLPHPGLIVRLASETETLAAALPVSPIQSAPALPMAEESKEEPAAPSTGRRSRTTDTGQLLQVTPREVLVPPLAAPTTYYDSREIDVFPQPVVPLRMLQMTADGRSGLTGTLQLEVRIDDQGAVTDVISHDPRVPPRLLGAARRMFFTTQFRPAGKSGRPVPSRIEVEVRYGDHREMTE